MLTIFEKKKFHSINRAHMMRFLSKDQTIVMVAVLTTHTVSCFILVHRTIYSIRTETIQI